MSVPQAAFSAALLDPKKGIPDGLVDPKGRPAGKRFDVYRNNVVVSLLDAMEAAFPAIQKMLGAEFFRAMAGEYVRQHPPQSPLLMFYGENFPAFLETFTPVEKYPYLADVARLELARRAAYHAADSAPVSPDALGAVSPDRLMEATFRLSPALRILSSPYPVVSLWEYNLIEGAPKPQPGAQTALITRPALDLEMRQLDAGTREFLLALGKNLPLANAFETALDTDPEFDLSAALGVMLQTEIITKIDL